MNHHQHKVHSLGKVPFSWEYQPGISKVMPQMEESPKAVQAQEAQNLPLPPCPSDSPKLAVHGLHIPLPPCPFQPPQRSSSKKGHKKEEDPFLAAYMECTKSTRHQVKVGKESKRGGGLGFSCKHSCGVREDGIVRMSQISTLHPRERFVERIPQGHRSLI